MFFDCVLLNDKVSNSELLFSHGLPAEQCLRYTRTRNAWQSPAYSPPGIVVSPPRERRNNRG